MESKGRKAGGSESKIGKGSVRKGKRRRREKGRGKEERVGGNKGEIGEGSGRRRERRSTKRAG